MCDDKESEERYGVYCSQECREKALKKLEKQKKQSRKRRVESEMKKFEEYLKSGRRTY